MKILVMDWTAKVFTLECESTDTIAHLKAKLNKITEDHLMFDGKRLGDKFSENMMLADVGIKDGSLILDSSLPRGYFTTTASCGVRKHYSICCSSFVKMVLLCGHIRPKRIPGNDYLYYADTFKSGWREEHAKAFLHLLLELCQDGTISDGNVTDEAWLRIQNSLKNSMKCSFQIDFLKERLFDYKQLYSVLTKTTSPFFKWDRERKTITITISNAFQMGSWRKEYPELLLLCGPYIPYFDTLEEVCLLVNTTRFSEQRVSETSTNINNAREASSSRGEICNQCPSDSNLSLIASSTLIGKENRYLSSTMKILVVDENAKVFPVECESTDTIAHLKQKLDKITKYLMFDGKRLSAKFSDNMTLADIGVQDGSLILLGPLIFRGSTIHHSSDPLEYESTKYGSTSVRCSAAFDMKRRIIKCFSILKKLERPRQRHDHMYWSFVDGGGGGAGEIERPQNPRQVPEKDYLYYADAFKSGWREEHAIALLHLLLELCQDGTISEGNVTDEAWLRIHNTLKNSIKCSFQIDFLKERLRDYKQLYSVLAGTSSSIFDWDRERNFITSKSNWREEYPELLLLCGPYIPYFDTLEKVCLLLNTGQSSEQRVFETSTNRNRVRQDIPRLSKLRSLFCLC